MKIPMKLRVPFLAIFLLLIVPLSANASQENIKSETSVVISKKFLSNLCSECVGKILSQNGHSDIQTNVAEKRPIPEELDKALSALYNVHASDGSLVDVDEVLIREAGIRAYYEPRFNIYEQALQERTEVCPTNPIIAQAIKLAHDCRDRWIDLF
ncbi:MAG: hypothetical protein HQK53_15485 [Oligoflexia bacterium]|nr:hypothetical protein [Oligoflexia bacterium]